MTKTTIADATPEIAAISTVHAALSGLEPEVQRRVLNYVAQMLSIDAPRLGEPTTSTYQAKNLEEASDTMAKSDITPKDAPLENKESQSDQLEGISPVAKKWMARNGLQAKQLSSTFSIGGDEIDLIAKTVPGKTKKERMHSVFLLKGVAAYLASGAARVTHEQMKETCLHYDAFDAANFAVHLKSLASEVSGGKSAGYTLTPRGLASATELVKAMTESTKTE